jgi:hypothetical protein
MAPRERERRPSDRAAVVSADDLDGSTLRRPADYAEHFTARCVQDAINCGLAATWERRRAAFLAARPRPGEFHGQRTSEELRAKWRELTAIADACRSRAAVSLRHEDIDPDVWAALGLPEAEDVAC